MEHEAVANVTWDEDTKWSGKITLADGKTAAFEIDGFEIIESIPEPALNTLKFLAGNEPLIRHRIAVSMKELYKDGWFAEQNLTPEELTQKIRLSNVSIYDEGDGALYYEADMDLLAGHWVQVAIDANGELGEPDIEG